jgi:hypothetical protein
MSIVNYVVPVEIDFGCIRTLPAECRAHGISRALLGTESGAEH